MYYILAVLIMALCVGGAMLWGFRQVTAKSSGVMDGHGVMNLIVATTFSGAIGALAGWPLLLVLYGVFCLLGLPT